MGLSQRHGEQFGILLVYVRNVPVLTQRPEPLARAVNRAPLGIGGRQVRLPLLLQSIGHDRPCDFFNGSLDLALELREPFIDRAFQHANGSLDSLRLGFVLCDIAYAKVELFFIHSRTLLESFELCHAVKDCDVFRLDVCLPSSRLVRVLGGLAAFAALVAFAA